MNSRVVDFRNRINDYWKRSNSYPLEKQGEFSKLFLHSLISEFGEIELDMPPFSFKLYREDLELRLIKGDTEKLIYEQEAKGYLDMIYNFRDELKIKDE